MTTISTNLQAVRARIAAAAKMAGRIPDDIGLLAVSKTFATERVREAAEAGQSAFGENYVQEGLAKIAALEGLGLEWHFIGPLQSNKTRPVAEHFTWVHGIERLKIAQRLSEARGTTQPPLQVCIQVNVSGEASKSGVSPDSTEARAAAESAGRDKTRFLAAASHDLRQPLHALALFVDALKTQAQTERGSHLIGRVETSVDTLQRLLDGLLERNPGEEMGWFWNIRELPEMPHASHLNQVLAGHEFQEAFKNYRDLRFLFQNLKDWEDKLGVFGDMLDPASRVHKTNPSGAGSPEATPSENGSAEKTGVVVTAPEARSRVRTAMASEAVPVRNVRRFRPPGGRSG